MIVSPSSSLEIRTTPHAGRSYYSTTFIPENSCVLDISTPYTYTIYKQFRNEVCSECFKYDGGRRSFLNCRVHSETAGLSFCDTRCQDTWLQREGADVIDLLTQLEAARRKSKQKAKDNTSEKMATLGTEEDIERVWEEVRKKEQNLKEVRKWRQLSLDDFQADLARYVLLALYHLFLELSDQIPGRSGDTGSVTYNGRDIGGSDWSSFTSLQSSEATRVKTFPELLDDHVNVYQVLKGTFASYRNPSQITGTGDECKSLRFSDVISIVNVRKALGVDAGNSFGIWERPLMDNSELLGFAVYPVPSFFNHDCSPTVRSSGDGRKLRFLTTRDVSPGAQLCISYGHVETLPVQERKKQLLDGWFFECVCRKCAEESAHPGCP